MRMCCVLELGWSFSGKPIRRIENVTKNMYTTALMWICVNPYAIIDKIYCCSVFAGSVNFLRDITNVVARKRQSQEWGSFLFGNLHSWLWLLGLYFSQLFARHKSQKNRTLQKIKPSTVPRRRGAVTVNPYVLLQRRSKAWHASSSPLSKDLFLST